MVRDELLALLKVRSFREGDFVLASGRRSAYYVDVRRTSLTGRGAWLIGNALVDAMLRQGVWPAVVGGLSMGADPLITATGMVAESRSLRLGQVYIRKEPKGHGTGQQLERGGDVPEAGEAVVLEDTTTTGGSSMKAVMALRNAGYVVRHVFTIVDRGEGASELLATDDLRLHALFGIGDLRS